MEPLPSAAKLPRISCVCLTYNRPRQLQRAIDDFLLQDYAGESELIVFNTCPLQEIQFDHPMVTVVNWRPRPKTLGACRNLAVEHSKFEVVVTWDDDDHYREDHLANLARELGDAPAVKANGFWSTDGRGPKQFNKRGPLNQMAFLRTLFNKVGGYPEINTREDRELYARFLEVTAVKEVFWDSKQASLTYNNDNGTAHVSWNSDYRAMGKLTPSERGLIDLKKTCDFIDVGNSARNDVAALTVYYNMGGHSRLLPNYYKFAAAWPSDTIPLWTVEVLCGDAKQEILGDRVLPVRVRDPFFHKESAINYGVSQLPDHITKVVWSDCDIVWDSYWWAARLSALLDSHSAVQLWGDLADTDRRGKVVGGTPSVMKNLDQGRPGGAWAAHRDFFRRLGLYNGNVVGGGDTVCAMGLGGGMLPARYMPLFREYLPIYLPKVNRWVADSQKIIGNTATFLDEPATHLWHGDKENRQYMTRHSLLNGVNPKLHLREDGNGFMEWTRGQDRSTRNEKILEYFKQRKES